MRDAITISNIALAAIGNNGITAFTNNSPAARACESAFNNAVHKLLSDYPWGFARKRVVLPLDVAPPLTDYANAYTLPTDFFTIVKLNSGVDAYSIEGNKLMTDAGSCELLYTARFANDADYPVYFEEAIASTMAIELNSLMSGDVSRQLRLESKAVRDMVNAQGIDAQQHTPFGAPITDLIKARFS